MKFIPSFIVDVERVFLSNFKSSESMIDEFWAVGVEKCQFISEVEHKNCSKLGERMKFGTKMY